MTSEEGKLPETKLPDPGGANSLASAFKFFHEANEAYWERRYKKLEDRIEALEQIVKSKLLETKSD